MECAVTSLGLWYGGVGRYEYVTCVHSVLTSAQEILDILFIIGLIVNANVLKK
jgi:hypothetical protein